MSWAPAKAYSLPSGTLARGARADITVFDEQREWTVRPERFHSLSRNTPFTGWKLRGYPVLTLVDGAVVWRTTEQ